MSCFIDLLYYRCNNVEKKKQIFTCKLIIVFYSVELFYFTGHFFFWNFFLGGGGSDTHVTLNRSSALGQKNQKNTSTCNATPRQVSQRVTIIYPLL